MKQLKIFVAGLAFVFMLSCDSSDEKPVVFTDQEYLPLAKGVYQIYQVDEIIYELGVAETLAYELKMVVTDSFLNAENHYTYVVHRSTRGGASDPWQPLDTWSVRKTGREAIVSEGNVPYLVMRFPLEEEMEWDGNTYNNQVNPNTNTGTDLYTVESKGSEKTYNGLTFADCVVIRQEDNQEYIVYHDKRYETYARGAGLVYKEKIQLEYCNDEDRNCVGQQIVDNGIIYKQQIKEYGRE